MTDAVLRRHAPVASVLRHPRRAGRVGAPPGWAWPSRWWSWRRWWVCPTPRPRARGPHPGPHRRQLRRDLVHRALARCRQAHRPVLAGSGRPRRSAVGGGRGPRRASSTPSTWAVRPPTGRRSPVGRPPTRAGPSTRHRRSPRRRRSTRCWSDRATTPTPPPAATRPSARRGTQLWFTPVVNPPRTPRRSAGSRPA